MNGLQSRTLTAGHRILVYCINFNRKKYNGKEESFSDFRENTQLKATLHILERLFLEKVTTAGLACPE
jgi:hypothetical protein